MRLTVRLLVGVGGGAFFDQSRGHSRNISLLTLGIFTSNMPCRGSRTPFVEREESIGKNCVIKVKQDLEHAKTMSASLRFACFTDDLLPYSASGFSGASLNIPISNKL